MKSLIKRKKIDLFQGWDKLDILLFNQAGFVKNPAFFAGSI
jgi:hypothetical protein